MLRIWIRLVFMFSDWAECWPIVSSEFLMKIFKLKAAGILTIKGLKMITKKKLRLVFLLMSYFMSNYKWVILYDSYIMHHFVGFFGLSSLKIHISDIKGISDAKVSHIFNSFWLVKVTIIWLVDQFCFLIGRF